MGSGSFSASDYASYSRSTAGKTFDKIYTSRSMDKDLDPKDIKIRESRDSADNPESHAIIVDFDVTGSMGPLAEHIARSALGKLFQELYDRKPVKNPHLMFMANGDIKAGDRAPLQVSQFEADNRIVEQMSKIYVEQGGGGNSSESYDLPWYFAAKKTSIDCFEKRGKKGYLFTVGDEPAPLGLTKENIKNVLGDTIEVSEYSPKELLAMAEQKYHVFHVLLQEGGGYSAKGEKSWKDLMGQHVLVLDDISKLSEVIISTIQVIEGEDVSTVVDSWDGSTAVSVGAAIKDLASGPKAADAVVRF